MTLLQVQNWNRETNTNRKEDSSTPITLLSFVDKEVDLEPGKSRANTCKRKLKLKIGDLIV